MKLLGPNGSIFRNQWTALSAAQIMITGRLIYSNSQSQHRLTGLAAPVEVLDVGPEDVDRLDRHPTDDDFLIGEARVCGAEGLQLGIGDDAGVVDVGVVPLEHRVAVHVRLGLVPQAALRQLRGVLRTINH